jgi:hypothetical protein
VYVLAGAAVLFVLVVLVQTVLPLRRRPRRPTAPAAAPARRDTPEAAWALADARARAGDFRAAVQAVFRGMLLALHRGGRLDYDPALTNREQVRRLGLGPEGRTAFERLVHDYDGVWYGLRPVDAGEYAAFQRRCRTLAGGPA